MLAVSITHADGSTLLPGFDSLWLRRGDSEVLSEEERRRCADELSRAGRLKKPVAQPSRSFPGLEARDAWRIQELWAQQRLAQGARLIGYKIGLTSPAMQAALQASEPVSGRIFDDAVHSPDEAIAVGRFLMPRVEAELAFILHRALRGPGVTLEDVLRTPHSVVPALEIVDRRTEMPRTLVDTIADNAAFGGLVLGARSLPPGSDLRRVGTTLSRNEAIEETGVSAAVMGHPAAAVAWLANRLHAAQAALEEGQIVLSGAFMPSVEVRSGDRVVADYGTCGTLEVSFV